MNRYLSGLCVAGLGLCGGGWLILAALAFPGETGDAGQVNLATGAALVLVGWVTAAAWAVAWRRRLLVDGVLRVPFPPVSRREARRNRRQLARDVRHAARLARRAARVSRRAARQERGRAGGPPGGVAGSSGLYQPAPPAAPVPPQAPAPGYGGNDFGGGAGHDGASAVDVLGEVRTLLGPLLTAAGSNQLPAQLPWPHSLPLWPASPGPAEQWPAEQWLTDQWPADVPPGAQWRPQQRPVGHAGERTPPSGPVPPRPAEPRPAECRRAEPRPAHPAHPHPRPRPGGPASDDELLRIADGEEAWW